MEEPPRYLETIDRTRALPVISSRAFAWGLVSPESVEPTGRQLCVSRRVDDVLVSQVVLNRARIVTIVGELVAGTVSEHVGVNGESDLCVFTSPCDDLSHGCCCQRSSAFSDEQIRTARIITL